MKRQPTNICPLLVISGIGSSDRPPAVCLECRCAWFHLDVESEDGTATGMCAIASIANSLAANSQALANLQQKAPASATNTDGSRVEQDLTGTVSTSTITENGGFVK